MTTEDQKLKTREALRALVVWCEKYGACIQNRDRSLMGTLQIWIGDDSIRADAIFREWGICGFRRVTTEEVKL